MKRKSVVVPKTIDVYSLGLCAFFSISLFSLSSLICLRKIFQQHRWISYMWMWEAKNWISTVQFWQDFILFAEQQKKMKKKSNKMLEEGKSLNKKKVDGNILEKGINAQTTKEIESFDFGTLNVYMRLNDLLWVLDVIILLYMEFFSPLSKLFQIENLLLMAMWRSLDIIRINIFEKSKYFSSCLFTSKGFGCFLLYAIASCFRNEFVFFNCVFRPSNICTLMILNRGLLQPLWNPGSINLPTDFRFRTHYLTESNVMIRTHEHSGTLYFADAPTDWFWTLNNRIKWSDWSASKTSLSFIMALENRFQPLSLWFGQLMTGDLMPPNFYTARIIFRIIDFCHKLNKIDQIWVCVCLLNEKHWNFFSVWHSVAFSVPICFCFAKMI